VPDKESDRETSEPKAAKVHDEAKIVPSDLTNKKFVQDLYTNITSDLERLSFALRTAKEKGDWLPALLDP
jgi:hypothetical protein